MGSTPPISPGPTRPDSGPGPLPPGAKAGPHRPAVGAARFLPAALAVLLVGIAIPLVGCGGGGGTDSTSSSGTAGSGSSTASAASGPQAVTISEYKYAPAEITVAAGTTIKFTNRDSTPHTATSKQAGAFETGPIDTGKTGEITLEKPGTYQYYCAFHPFMKGTIVVE